jgi:hypothetical protein
MVEEEESPEFNVLVNDGVSLDAHRARPKLQRLLSLLRMLADVCDGQYQTCFRISAQRLLPSRSRKDG